jgi:serine O-acetyltransferase
VHSTDEPISLGQQIREDWQLHFRSVTMPGFQALLIHRVSNWARPQPLLVRKSVRGVCRVLNTFLIRNVYGMEIFDSAVIGRRVMFGHHVGVVVGSEAVLGNDIEIQGHVTIGQNGTSNTDQPHVGNDVQFGAGATVVGPITVGDGARIGPGAVVVSNVPPGAKVMAPLGRMMKPAEPPTTSSTS